MNELVREYNTKCYSVDYKSALNYFQTNPYLHPIEGFWNLSCNNLSFKNHLVEDSDFALNLSSWAIIHQDSTYYVCDFGKSYLKGIDNFKATFRCHENNFYNYECNFYKPEWSVKVPAILMNDSIITYSYFVDKIYFNYELDKDVMWNFIWTKNTNLQLD